MGGHGGLNILPQKRWNVYRQDNREKVRQDEEKHAEEIEKQRKKQVLYDGEIRRSLLLERVKEKKKVEGNDTCDLPTGEAQPVEVAEETFAGHINLFEGLVEFREGKVDGERERGGMVARSSVGVDVTAGKKKEEDIKFSLGYGAKGEKGEEPWYAQKGSIYRSQSGTCESGSVSLKKRASMDTERNAVKRRKTTEELRQERFQRERCERERANKLVAIKTSPIAVNPVRMSTSAGEPVKGLISRPSRYNSGFGYGR